MQMLLLQKQTSAKQEREPMKTSGPMPRSLYCEGNKKLWKA